MSSNNPWKTLKVTEIYDNPWIKLTHEDVLIPNGHQGIYGKVHFKNIAVGIIPIDENNNTWLVGQFRYTINEYSWEIPEGGALIPQDPLEAAQKELAEEVGLGANKWELIAKLHNSNSVTDETAYIYVAKDLYSKEGKLDDTEVIERKKLPIKEAIKMAMNGEITDSMSIVALLKFHILEQQKEENIGK
ncbi:MAG: NUDIX hydrolase [Chitinophagales bacterium]|nr:NUDIX hydrolase [Chitinophagales bacterium]MCZ2394762.1 NUDIX hydrolase [Chitinophagales bacterium]